MTLFGEDNEMIGDPFRDPDEESGYEALFLIDDIFYVVRESIQDLDEDGEVRSCINALSLPLGLITNSSLARFAAVPRGRGGTVHERGQKGLHHSENLQVFFWIRGRLQGIRGGCRAKIEKRRGKKHSVDEAKIR